MQPNRKVPNAPCGVESSSFISQEGRSTFVPNAPCGVESKSFFSGFGRRELVPNAPCGVESNKSVLIPFDIAKFLMHRVELKASILDGGSSSTPSS